MASFKIGDRAILIKSMYGASVGRVVTVLSVPFGNLFYPNEGPGHEIDCPNYDDSAGTSWAPVSWLKPYYDGNEKTSWAEVAEWFQPNRVTRKEGVE